MTSIRRKLLVGVALVIGSAATANAADMMSAPMGGMKDFGTPIPVESVPAPMPIQDSARFYFRGDLGYGWNSTPDLTEPDLILPGVVHELSGVDVENQWALGGGVGMYLNRHLRADFTVDWRFKGAVKGTLRDNHAYSDNPNQPAAGLTQPQVIYSPEALLTYDHGAGTYTRDTNGNLINGIYAESNGTPVKTHLAGDYKFNIQSTVFLANMYYDFRSRAGFTPYVGAGVGFARHKFSSGTVDVAWDRCCGVINGGIRDETDTTLAAAAMAGFSYNLRSGLYLDAGYRFLWMGKTQTGLAYANNADQTIVGTGAAIDNADPIIENLHAHEIRVGVRYDLN